MEGGGGGQTCVIRIDLLLFSYRLIHGNETFKVMIHT